MCADQWPEQEAVWRWMKKHGIELTQYQENDLKYSVSRYRILEQERLARDFAEIAKGEGPFKRDAMEHAVSVINNMVTLAAESYESIKGHYPEEIWPQWSGKNNA